MPAANSQMVHVQRAEMEQGRFLMAISHDIERDHGTRLRRMTELDALGRHLRVRLCRDGFWPEAKELAVTFGEEPFPFAEDSQFAVLLPGYSSKWSSRRFEDAACVAATQVLKAIAPRAPSKQYLAEFERLRRTFSWSHRAETQGAAAELEFSLTRNSFKARLKVAHGVVKQDFPVFRSGADTSDWGALFGKLRITNRQVVIEAVSGTFVRVVRKGRAAARWTGRDESLERFVVGLEPAGPRVTQKFELNRSRPDNSR